MWSLHVWTTGRLDIMQFKREISSTNVDRPVVDIKAFHVRAYPVTIHGLKSWGMNHGDGVSATFDLPWYAVHS